MTFKVKKFVTGEIQKVWTHNIPSDYNWCVCDVLILDAVPDGSEPENPNGIPHVERCPVKQLHIGNRFGMPWTPKVGDMVYVGIEDNDKYFIDGTQYNDFQRPPCYSSAHPGIHMEQGADGDWYNAGAYEDISAGLYDWMMKFRQYQPVQIRPNQTYFKHPFGPEDESKNRPVCILTRPATL
jgi:hypothetical protein